MSKVLQNRRSSFAQATQKETELTHIVSLANHFLYSCSKDCYATTLESYYRDGKDLECENNCYTMFVKL